MLEIKILILLALIPMTVIPIFADSLDSNSKCGAGTVFDEANNTCVLEGNKTIGENDSYCGQGTIFDPDTNSCILEIISHKVVITIETDTGSSVSTDDCVDVEYGCYIPGTATVDLGGVVIFHNTDSAAHTFTAGSAADGPTGEFDTSLLLSGSSYEWTADVVGEIPYFCMVHPWMDGMLIINGHTSILPDKVVINEVDINPPGNDTASISEWVELYNPTNSSVNIGNWEIASTTVLKKTLTLSNNTIIMPGEFLTYSYQTDWFTDSNESVELRDENGIVIDKTPLFADLKNDFTSWQRIYDGYDFDSSSDWKFVTSTTGSSNGKIAPEPPTIPQWIKNNAGWWADGSIDDNSFVQGVQFLINEEILVVNTINIPNEFPLSLKVTAGLWANGQISDDQFLEILKDWIEKRPLNPIPELTAKDIQIYKQKIDNWNNATDRLTDRADILESKGKYEKASYLHLKASYFELLIETTRNFICTHSSC